jgi:GNAT superfamily N-acetyltransferase
MPAPAWRPTATPTASGRSSSRTSQGDSATSSRSSTPPPPFTEDVFRARFDELAALGADHLVLVAEDASTGLLAGAVAVLVERKFIRRCGLVGHVKDVVVDASARGRGLGERLVEHARERGCYKVIHTRLHSGAEGILRQMRIRGEERPDGTLLLI